MGFLPGATRPNKKDLKRGKVKIKAGVERVPVHLCPPPIRAQVKLHAPYFKHNRKLKRQGSLTLKANQFRGETGVQTQVCLIPEPGLIPRHYMTFQDASLPRSNYQHLPLKH